MIFDHQWVAAMRGALWADILFGQDGSRMPRGEGDAVSEQSRPCTPAELFLLKTESQEVDLAPGAIIVGAARIAETSARGRAYTPTEDMLVEDADLLR